MNKIKALYVGNLTNPKHVNYMLFVKKAIAKYLKNDEIFAALIIAFNFAYDKEDEIYLKHQRKFLTEEVTEKENLRDLAFRAFRGFLISCSLLPETEKANAAKKLLDVVELYGGAGIVSKAWDAESGILSNMIEDFETVYAAQIETIGAGSFLTNLKTANETFLDTLAARTQSDADFGKSALLGARQTTDATYRALIYSINAYVTIGKGAPYQEFINFLNAEIERYRIQLGVGVGKPEEGELEEEFPEEELPEEELPPTEEEPTTPGETEPTTPPAGGENNGAGSGSTETPTDPTKILLLFNDGAHGNVIVKRMEVAPGYQLSAADLPEGFVYAFKADDQADIDAASPGDTVWITLAPRG